MMHYNPNSNVPHYVTLSRAALVEAGDSRMFEQQRYDFFDIYKYNKEHNIWHATLSKKCNGSHSRGLGTVKKYCHAHAF